MKRLISPRLLIPTILSLALFMFLVGLSGPDELRSALMLTPAHVGEVLGLACMYFVCKGVAWYLLLRRLDVKASPSEIAFCFSGGEVAKNLPGGAFFQNYLLNRIMGAHFAYTAGASLSMMGLEGVITYILLLILGLPHVPGVRALLGIIAGVGLAVLAASWWWELPRRLVDWGRAHHSQAIQSAAVHLEHFIRALKTLAALHLVTPGLLLVGGFLVAQALTLYIVATQLPIPQLTVIPSLDVFALSIFLPLVFPFPIQFGLSELSGMAAMMAYGADRQQAIAAMIAFRVWGVGVTMLMGAVGMLVLPELLKRALSVPPAGPGVPTGPSRLP